MATMQDFEFLNQRCGKSFYDVFSRQQISYVEIERVANNFISNALTLYLELPTASDYEIDWIPSQYDVFGNRVCEITRSNNRKIALISDFIESVQRCGIIFVCAPPGTDRERSRNG